MNSIDIANHFYTNGTMGRIVHNIAGYSADADDLIQDLYLSMVSIPIAKIAEAHRKGEMAYYITRIVLNQFRSKTSKFHYTYRKPREGNTSTDALLNIPDDQINSFETPHIYLKEIAKMEAQREIKRWFEIPDTDSVARCIKKYSDAMETTHTERIRQMKKVLPFLTPYERKFLFIYAEYKTTRKVATVLGTNNRYVSYAIKELKDKLKLLNEYVCTI